MPTIVLARFKPCAKTFKFDATGFEVKVGDLITAESDFGVEIARVIAVIQTDEDTSQLKKILRLTSKEDLLSAEENKKLNAEAKVFCLERIKARSMPMKLVTVEATLDRKRIVFYFTADGRIDFRELVKDLAARFKTRIELRQIGIRDESRMLGGIGICGKELCCSKFLTTFEPVSIKMAKKQELALNVSKLSGLCGRLMCCLRFEYDGSEPVVEDEIPLETDSPDIYLSDKKISELLLGIDHSDEVLKEDTAQADVETVSSTIVAKEQIDTTSQPEDDLSKSPLIEQNKDNQTALDTHIDSEQRQIIDAAQSHDRSLPHTLPHTHQAEHTKSHGQNPHRKRHFLKRRHKFKK